MGARQRLDIETVARNDHFFVAAQRLFEEFFQGFAEERFQLFERIRLTGNVVIAGVLILLRFKVFFEATDILGELVQCEIAKRIRIRYALLAFGQGDIGIHHELGNGVGFEHGKDHVIANEPQRPVEIGDLGQGFGVDFLRIAGRRLDAKID